MKSVWIGTLSLLGLILAVTAASTQPPPVKGPGDRKGSPPTGAPRFELGRVLPPPLVDQLELTEKQRAEIVELEREIKERLSKILTAEQKKQLESFRTRGPGGKSGPPRREPDRSDRPEKEKTLNSAGGIQWFATWESGLREARRTGKPILLVSAAPHCAGVSGTW